MKILITRPRAQADDFADKLRSAGFEPILFPVIEIQPIENNIALERALEKLNCYEWVVFTSVNAVDAVFLPPSSLRDTPPIFKENGGSWRGAKIAAIGPKTAEALRKRSIEPDFVPDEYVAEAILPGLGDLQGKWVLLPRAEIARADLPEAIAKAGGIPHEIIVYRTLPATVDPNGLNALKSGVDVVTFTSASTVENFVAICKQNRLDPLNLPNNPLIACIGPITEQAAREAGFENVVVAEEYTTDGLVEEIVNRYTSRQVDRYTSRQVNG
ncbi:MAG: uroporphyrinogen-III synthase [Chloroflexota bacterium]|nr:uroporphyrinogen-III synthase [Chloroflexota bacterium]MBI5704636.1 uroporphyrinogen-III synthase [Chloroflexota bacterium]